MRLNTLTKKAGNINSGGNTTRLVSIIATLPSESSRFWGASVNGSVFQEFVSKGKMFNARKTSRKHFENFLRITQTANYKMLLSKQNTAAPIRFHLDDISSLLWCIRKHWRLTKNACQKSKQEGRNVPSNRREYDAFRKPIARCLHQHKRSKSPYKINIAPVVNNSSKIN